MSIKGFRPYGKSEQTLLLGNIAAVWGTNSKGKSSLAEAFEFLLTGSISRREMLASSQDEFADSLRNAHMHSAEDVYVSAQVIAENGAEYTLKRTLISDYGKRQDCASRLEIDGSIATEGHLTGLGFTFSQPPLRAPVLAQHTLSHIFSVRPQDRATYFKALFEVTDLDDLRNRIAGLAAELEPSIDPLLSKFDVCVALPLLASSLTMRTMPDTAGLANKLDQCATILLKSVNGAVPATQPERITAVEELLSDLRGKTFPVKAFERKQITGWSLPADTVWKQIDTFVYERSKIDEKTRQLSALFNEALKLPSVYGIDDPICCPLCETEGALTSARVAVIRQHLENTSGYNTADIAAKSAISQLSASISNLIGSIDTALPLFCTVDRSKRLVRGFTVPRLRLLLGDDYGPTVNAWLAALKPILRIRSLLLRATKVASEAVSDETRVLASLDVGIL